MKALTITAPAAGQMTATTSSRPSNLSLARHMPRRLNISNSAFHCSIACLRSNKLSRKARQPRQRVSAFEEDDQQFIREWPDKNFIAEVEDAFPDQGIANVEEARALVSSLGYTYLDVRPALELEEVGKVRECVNIPIVNATKRWDSKEQKKVVKKEDNPNFVAQVEKRFPDKENAKLLIACSNGRTYSMDALEALDEAGYVNLAGLKGGYYAWFGVFDHKLNRRRTGEYQEQYTHDGDSAGIHGSGAGFPRMDPADRWVPPEF